MYITGPVEATRIWGGQVHITYVVVLVEKKGWKEPVFSKNTFPNRFHRPYIMHTGIKPLKTPVE